MEQALTYSSPYRNKSSGKSIHKSKIIKKIIIQTIFCGVIFITFVTVNKIDSLRNSALWQNILYLLKYDIDIEKTSQTFNNAISYLSKNILSTEEKHIIEPVDEKEQMQIDVEEIKKITKVIRPVPSAATSRYGKRTNENGEETLHTGVDLEAQIGTPIKAAISGKVIEVKELENSFGKFIRIQNEDIITTYAHCSSIEVSLNDEIMQGEIIAYSGNTGNSTGPHLHFEITKSGRYVDPGFLLTYE